MSAPATTRLAPPAVQPGPAGASAPRTRPPRGRAGSPRSRPAGAGRRPDWRALWPWYVLWPWSAAWAAWHIHGAGQSWHFFAAGGRLLLAGSRGGGLHLYAAHPQLQIGPLTLAVSGTLEALGPWPSRVAAIAAMSATGPPLLAAIWRLAPRAGRRRSQLLMAGLVFLPVWTEVTTHFAHLDDLLALGFSVAAAHAVARRHPLLAGLALAAAADAKPWAAAFVPMLLALPRPQRWAALGAFGGGVTAVWLPFLLADPHTLFAAQFTIPNDHSSALRVLGVNAARTPWWDRPAQLALGMAGGCLAVWRRRWPAVILLAVSARILLDPGVYSYYTSGALLGTVLVDLVVTRWRLPWATITGAVLLYAARFTSEVYPFTLHELGVLRAVFAVGMPALVLGVPGWLMARRPGRHARGPAGLQPAAEPVPAQPDPAQPDPAQPVPAQPDPAQPTAGTDRRPPIGAAGPQPLPPGGGPASLPVRRPGAWPGTRPWPGYPPAGSPLAATLHPAAQLPATPQPATPHPVIPHQAAARQAAAQGPPAQGPPAQRPPAQRPAVLRPAAVHPAPVHLPARQPQPQAWPGPASSSHVPPPLPRRQPGRPAAGLPGRRAAAGGPG